ncbi:uncharacterized protein BDW43DRAFT_211489 [Aspergillus alliaceus]|uniref:uncharacterized protein n=1 Tax=Petromyces alliaceus TaxID=209559 RepID=UPI0012A4B303|nr:uncharacterized protein BDW43DRAFT_211489 [Aspergillus alliaceus]KAB8228756.1 hypothetical protein BDW43DRAFT_211489 [Aspergillus alliaceus]
MLGTNFPLRLTSLGNGLSKLTFHSELPVYTLQTTQTSLLSFLPGVQPESRYKNYHLRSSILLFSSSLLTPYTTAVAVLDIHRGTHNTSDTVIDRRCSPDCPGGCHRSCIPAKRMTRRTPHPFINHLTSPRNPMSSQLRWTVKYLTTMSQYLPC